MSCLYILEIIFFSVASLVKYFFPILRVNFSSCLWFLPLSVLCVLPRSLKLPFCLIWLAHHEVIFLGAGISPYLQLPTRGAGLFFDSSFLSVCLSPTWLWGDFSCPFRCLKSSTNVQQLLCEKFPLVDISLVYLWGEMNSVTYFTILTARASTVALLEARIKI